MMILLCLAEDTQLQRVLPPRTMHLSTLILHILLNTLVWQVVIVDGRAIISSASHTHPSDVKYFERDLDTNIGYWSPSSSSIDWCERNYVVTWYIAEFWNCLSSFSMCILGGILFIRGVYNKVETRFLFSSLGFVVVGLGSAYFHGTLTHLGQMADELPMVYSMIIWWFILFRMNDFERNKDKRFVLDMSICFGIFYAFLWTYVHKLQTFVVIFQVHMSLMVLGAIVRLIYLSRQTHHHFHGIGRLLVVYVGLLIAAFVCWVLDQQLCERLNNISPFNPQLHAWWHALGAVHCHLGIVCGEAMRLLSIKYSNSKKLPFKADDHVRLIYHFGLPYVDYSHEKITNKSKAR